MSAMVAALELGGTKTVVALGDDAGVLIEVERFPTTTPQETLSRACSWWRERCVVTRLGIASFGPLRVNPLQPDYGTFLTTPKAGWQGFSLREFFQRELPDACVTIATDVEAALLAEMECGAAVGMKDAVYFTVGTGIGAGIACGGRLVRGTLHPEMGHLRVTRHPEDLYAGSCPYHHDCWEGLASGPAMARRWGQSPQALPSDHRAWDMEAFYLAQGFYAAAATLAPQRMIFGGGLAQVPDLLGKIIREMERINAGYLESPGDRLVHAGLGQDAGIIGALLLTARDSLATIGLPL